MVAQIDAFDKFLRSITRFGDEELDLVFSKNFSGKEMKEVWEKIEALALDEVRGLLLKHEPQLLDLAQTELGLHVAKLARRLPPLLSPRDDLGLFCLKGGL